MMSSTTARLACVPRIFPLFFELAQRMEEFLLWLNRNDFPSSKLQIAHFGDSGTGFMAKESISVRNFECIFAF